MFTASANASGNFFADVPAFEYPYRAKIRFQGREREMVAAQLFGDCNGCHPQSGNLSAPGRILLP